MDSDTTLKNELLDLFCIIMPGPANLLPVYGADDSLRGYVSISTAQRLLDKGHAVPRGTRHRVRALIIVFDNVDLLISDRPPIGQRFSHNRETAENPQGVWTFRKLTAR